MFKKISFFFVVVFFCITQSSLHAINLKKVASLDSAKIFSSSVTSGHDITNLFFDQGRKILIGQDLGFPENYKFYLIKNPTFAEQIPKTPLQIKEYEEISFSYNQFCSKAKKENKDYICDVSRPATESDITRSPILWYINSEQEFAILVIEILSPEKDRGRDLYLTHLNIKTKEITKIKKIPGNTSFGLDYINQGDLQKEDIRWFSDAKGSLFRINFPTMELTENKACGDKFSKIYSDHQSQMAAEQKRTGKDLIRMPFIALTPFVSADEKYALLFDYSDIEDGHNNNPIGLAYYCEMSTGKLEKFPGQHTVYAATMSIPGKIIYYNNQRGEYHSLDIATKKLTQVLKGRNMGDFMVIYEDSAIVYDDDYTWVEARKLSNLKQVKSYSLVSMEKIKNNYLNRVVINPQSSTLLFANYEQGDYGTPSKMKLFIYKMSLK